ncbi:hypothetical protein LINPERPRIM_LOCUS26653 [Linum perenne]
MGGYTKIIKPIATPNSSDFIPKLQKPEEEEENPAKETEQHQHQQQQQPQLRRNSSVSSAATHLKKRAISSFSFSSSNMRRSSSVSERYCRIHDQSSVFLPPASSSSPTHYETQKMDDPVSPSRSVKKKLSKSGIVRACKKMLGL